MAKLAATYELVIASVLSVKRKDTNLTQKQFGARVGLSEFVVARMEQGHTGSLANLYIFTRGLQIQPWELFKEVDDLVNFMRRRDVAVVVKIPEGDDLVPMKRKVVESYATIMKYEFRLPQ